MNTRSIVLPLCAALLLLAGCQKKETPVTAAPPPKPAAVEMVKESERSRHFLAVSRQLELGGTLYGYVDVDGDVLKIGGLLNEVLGKMAEAQPAKAPFLKQDYAALFSGLGLADIKAVGFSSVPDGRDSSGTGPTSIFRASAVVCSRASGVPRLRLPGWGSPRRMRISTARRRSTFRWSTRRCASSWPR